ncbi:MAG: hypothetical protein WDA42_08440 [Candidatus Bathyarchaeia archaeon]|jgi:hypothetical protein
MGEQWIFLMGSLAEGFEAFGPYDSWEAADDMHGAESGCIMQLLKVTVKDADSSN